MVYQIKNKIVLDNLQTLLGDNIIFLDKKISRNIH